MSRAEADFERVLPRLVAAYRRGRLVPFIGGGLSVPICATWSLLVGALEREAGIIDEPPTEHTFSQELIRRANRAVRRLRGRSPEGFPSSVRRALRVDGQTCAAEPPAQCNTLASLWWPLVLSTNYDDLFLTAFERVHGPGQLDVVGRSPTDCQRVLDALYSPSSALLWAVQGFFGGVAAMSSDEAEEHRLAHELVVGHEEYRRVTHREPHFRRAFGEVFRARSFLFLGSGLKEAYVLELLGEVLELLGASANPNFALVLRDEVDPDFLASRFETTVVEYDDHAEVPVLLDMLADAIRRASARVVHWSWAMAEQQLNGTGDVEIVRGRLATPPQAGECAAISAGGGGDMAFLGRGGRAFLEIMQVDQRGAVTIGLDNAATAGGAYARALDPPEPLSLRGWRVARITNVPVYLVRARTDEDEYALGLIAGAFESLLDSALCDGFGVLHTTLIASGGRETRKASNHAHYHQRPYPSYYSLIQMLRAYGRWRRADPAHALRVVIYVIDQSVAFELESSRLDVTELLAGDPRLRFWTEARVRGGGLDRRLNTLPDSTTIGDVAEALDLPPSGWLVDVVPLPRLGGAMLHRIEAVRDTTLAGMDVVPGATLRFHPVGG